MCVIKLWVTPLVCCHRLDMLFMIVPLSGLVMYCVIYDCSTSCLVWSCIVLFMIVPHHVWFGHVLCYL